MIGFCGGLREDDAGVGGESFEVVLQQFLESLPTADEGDEHEHSPEDTEARQERTAFVSCQSVEDFFVRIYIDAHVRFAK